MTTNQQHDTGKDNSAILEKADFDQRKTNAQEESFDGLSAAKVEFVQKEQGSKLESKVKDDLDNTSAPNGTNKEVASNNVVVSEKVGIII